MQIDTKTGLFGAALAALMLGVASPAAASETMCNTKPMASDTMKSDDMAMSDDSMAKDDMAMDDSMSSDTMASDDGMAKDDMAKDDMAMSDTMSDDSMSKDDMAMDDSMSSDGMMMGSYTVKAGDSLWKIAAATLCDGDRYPEIVAANKDMLHGMMTIHPGQMLHIPGD